MLQLLWDMVSLLYLWLSWRFLYDLDGLKSLLAFMELQKNPEKTRVNFIPGCRQISGVFQRADMGPSLQKVFRIFVSPMRNNFFFYKSQLCLLLWEADLLEFKIEEQMIIYCFRRSACVVLTKSTHTNLACKALWNDTPTYLGTYNGHDVSFVSWATNPSNTIVFSYLGPLQLLFPLRRKP